jgi:hypothetical protein
MILSDARPFFLDAIRGREKRLGPFSVCNILCLSRGAVIIMFNVDIAMKRVVIAHTVEARDGQVDLTTTFDLSDVSEEKVLLWAATNRLTRWITSFDLCQLSSTEVKQRFDHLVIECREYFQSNTPSISREEKIILENLRKSLREGVSLENVLQSLIRSTLQFGH